MSSTVYSSLSGLQLTQPCLVVLGTFDGVHTGHQALLQHGLQVARQKGLTPVVFTFSNHPRQCIAPKQAPLALCMPKQKLEWFEQLGFSTVVMPAFTQALKTVTATAFLQEYLLQQLNAKVVVVGENFCFGKEREGCPTWLKQESTRLGFEVEVLPLKQLTTGFTHSVTPEVISSSACRKALQLGNLPLLQQLLGRPWCLEATVVKGQQLGRTLGFPTANLVWPEGLCRLPYGVYAATVQEGRSAVSSEPEAELLKPTWAVCNWGERPTLEQSAPVLEVHCLQTSEGDSNQAPEALNLYGKTLKVSFQAFLRQQQRFESLDALKLQITSDCEQARLILQSENR
jgi:riboflavin kinase / FMN adenylyltransferase